MNESLVEADKLGRLCDTSEQKKTMVEASRASGQNAPRFAAHHGLNYQTLVSWIKKDKSSPAPPACHVYHSYFVANLRISLGVEVRSGNEHAAAKGLPGLWDMLGKLPRHQWPTNGPPSVVATAATAARASC